MISRPEVSVVIPFYSRVDWLEEALDSVLAQTYSSYEIIVVNDGSQEDITKFLSKYSHKIRYIKMKHGGSASARNKGIQMATGDYIAFLDSDDLWESHKLELQISAMKLQNAIWSYCGWKTFGMGQSVSYAMTTSSNPIFQKQYNPHIATPSVIIEKKFFDEHPDVRFNSFLQYGEDSYLWLCIGIEFPILALPDELVYVRMRGSNSSKSARIQLRANSDIWKMRKLDKKRLIDGCHIGLLYIIASELCVFGDYIASCMEYVLSQRICEMISKVMYLVPWCLYKMDRCISVRRNGTIE